MLHLSHELADLAHYRFHFVLKEEVLAMLKATHRLALQNIPLIAGGPGLEKRGNPTVNSKMRGEFKVSAIRTCPSER